jgi:hypothetical protein
MTEFAASRRKSSAFTLKIASHYVVAIIAFPPPKKSVDRTPLTMPKKLCVSALKKTFAMPLITRLPTRPVSYRTPFQL